MDILPLWLEPAVASGALTLEQARILLVGLASCHGQSRRELSAAEADASMRLYIYRCRCQGVQ